MTDIDIHAVSRHLETRLPAYLDDLRALVSVDSGTFDKGGVDAVTATLRERYDGMGATIEVYPHATYGDTLVARIRGGGEGRILLIGHTDTVYPAGTVAARPFSLADGRAYGPGTADMKGGDLSIVYALSALQNAWGGTLGEVTIVHNSDEEIGSPSSRDLIERLSREADAVLVLEAGRENGNIVSARKGVADVQLWVEGVASHAGVNHGRGRSAVLELANLVVALEGLNSAFPDVTVNVGQVEGGVRPNVVPDRAYAHLEVRAMHRAHLEQTVARLEGIVGRRTVDGTSARCAVSISHWPMERSAETERLVQMAQELAGELGFQLRDTATGGASDGNTASAAGRPVLDGLGPVGGSAHSPGEYILVESVVPRTALLAGLIAKLSAGSAL